MLFFTLPQIRLNFYNPRALVTTETPPINSKPFSKTVGRANMKESASLCKVWHPPPTLLTLGFSQTLYGRYRVLLHVDTHDHVFVEFDFLLNSGNYLSVSKN